MYLHVYSRHREAISDIFYVLTRVWQTSRSYFMMYFMYLHVSGRHWEAILWCTLCTYTCLADIKKLFYDVLYILIRVWQTSSSYFMMYFMYLHVSGRHWEAILWCTSYTYTCLADIEKLFYDVLYVLTRVWQTSRSYFLRSSFDINIHVISAKRTNYYTHTLDRWRECELANYSNLRRNSRLTHQTQYITLNQLKLQANATGCPSRLQTRTQNRVRFVGEWRKRSSVHWL